MVERCRLLGDNYPNLNVNSAVQQFSELHAAYLCLNLAVNLEQNSCGPTRSCVLNALGGGGLLLLDCFSMSALAFLTAETTNCWRGCWSEQSSSGPT